MKRYIKKLVNVLVYTLMICVMPSCSDSFFDKQPLDEVSDETFWLNESDAQMALTACYNHGYGWMGLSFWGPRPMLWLDLMAGFGSEKEEYPDSVTNGDLTSSNWVVGDYWSNTWTAIVRCNNFLDHINDIEMDDDTRERMIADIRVLRAYHYFWLAIFWGDVPLVTTVLSLEEANSVSRTDVSQIWDFVESELSESAEVLPETVSDSELGRMTKGAAYAILGRAQMAQEEWEAAAATYKTIIDLGVYTIQDSFQELFWESNEYSDEIILASQYLEDDFYHVLPQYLYPEVNGGWHQFSPYNELVERFECTDGLTIDESPLYNEDEPYENRDPRMLYTVMINRKSSFNGQLFISEPGSGSSDAISKYSQWSGYSIAKFMDGSFDGNLMNYGGNFILIRYPEVLLSYLECMLEAGETITQSLLDETVNLVRGRESVNMPAVTETDTDELREIVRRERSTELAFEGLHYYDILRWGIGNEELNRQFTGMKLTTDPDNYTVRSVDDDGYALCQTRVFVTGTSELWPIPLSEIQLNSNLTQNPGY
ncbi:MAG: RagB/SusD family nutrient uptake outer membrane protein [Bacteroides sp.]|nr:RagB/SusD family nutrient uptake outer membrane protein [Bacteroides sp.]